MNRFEKLKKEKLKHISYSGAAFNEGWDTCAIEYEKLLDKLEDKIYHATRRVEELEYLIANKDAQLKITMDALTSIASQHLDIKHFETVELDKLIEVVQNDTVIARNALKEIKE